MERVRGLMTRSHELLDEAIERFVVSQGKELVATVGLYSGGDDSTVLVDLFRARLSHLGHANTTIGIEDTRMFVREMAQWWGIPLLERLPPQTYRELVIDQGFPGPAQHFKMYQRLKERCLRQIRRELVIRPREQRVVFLAGRRRDESQRRANVPTAEREGSVVWVSPLVEWTKLDLNAYRRLRPELPRNPVSANLHMSGECLCGSFAHKGELDEIGFWYPQVRKAIEVLELEVAAAGHSAQRSQWGWGAYRDRAASLSMKVGPLCSSCEVKLKMATEDYEIICPCGGEFTVRLTSNRYGCVRCCAEVELPPLWLDCEMADLDAIQAETDSFVDGWINEAWA